MVFDRKLGAKVLAAAVGFLSLAVLRAPAAISPPELISDNPDGTPGNGDSYEGQVTPNGRYVVFDTRASNLGVNFTASDFQIVLRDRKEGTNFLVSHGAAGEAGNGDSWDPCISANGRWIVFYSSADNLVTGDLDGTDDLFLYDRVTDQTTMLPLTSAGDPVNGRSQIYGASLTPNGRSLVFFSQATDLLPAADNGSDQVFMMDLKKGTVTLLSADGAGVQGNGASRYPSISPNGKWVAFESIASNLVAGDANGSRDAFVRDMRHGTIARASVSSGGVEGNNHSDEPVVSNNGRYVAFWSYATNFVAADGNGSTDEFLRDMKAGTTIRISEPAGGGDATGGDCYECCMTPSGKTIVYYSYATNLNPDHASPAGGVYLYDVKNGTTTQLDLAPNGDAPDGVGYVWQWSLTASGKWLLMSSQATQFTTGDTAGKYQVYLVQLK